MTNQEKGDLLEDVVESIEKFLLSQNPGIKYHDLTIERKKRIIIDDVLHEIDLFIFIDMGNGYNAIYIFECKNWDSKSVDKNEIIVFSEKIQAVNATKGFFIAKKFSQYAISQSKKNGRIELVIANEELEKFPFGTAAPSFNQELNNLEISLYLPENNISVSLEPTESNTFLNGSSINFTEYAKQNATDFVSRKYGKSEIPTDLKIVESPDNLKIDNNLEVGTYSFIDKVSFHIPENLSLIIDKTKIGKFHLKISHTIQIIEPSILWQYDVEKRGRVGYFKYETPDGDYLMKMTGGDKSTNVRIEVNSMDIQK